MKNKKDNVSLSDIDLIHKLVAVAREAVTGGKPKVNIPALVNVVNKCFKKAYIYDGELVLNVPGGYAISYKEEEGRWDSFDGRVEYCQGEWKQKNCFKVWLNSRPVPTVEQYYAALPGFIHQWHRDQDEA